MKERRKLKVYKRTSDSGRDMPVIVLQGNWLMNHGFNPGDFIAVECEENDLHIVKRDPDASELETISERIEKLTPAQKRKVSAALDEMGF